MNIDHPISVFRSPPSLKVKHFDLIVDVHWYLLGKVCRLHETGPVPTL